VSPSVGSTQLSSAAPQCCGRLSAPPPTPSQNGNDTPCCCGPVQQAQVQRTSTSLSQQGRKGEQAANRTHPIDRRHYSYESFLRKVGRRTQPSNERRQVHGRTKRQRDSRLGSLPRPVVSSPERRFGPTILLMGEASASLQARSCSHFSLHFQRSWTPLTSALARQAAAAITTLLGGAADPSALKHANAWLISFTATREAWAAGLALLDHPQMEASLARVELQACFH
jgi:hypothetical protein